MPAKRFACLWGGLLAATLVCVQPPARAEELSRERVIQLALERAPLVLAADARRLEAEGRLAGARILGANPTVDLVTGNDVDGRRLTEAELTIPIGFGFRRARRIDLAGAELERDADLARDARRLAVAAALEAHVRALHAREQLRVAGERLALAERLRDLVREKYAAGDVARLDLVLAESELSRSRSGILAGEQDLVRARAELAMVLGIPSTPEPELSGELADRSRFDELPADTAALADRPDLRAAAGRLRAAEAERSLAGTEALPELSFRLNYLRAGDDDEWLPGLAISLPIFDRGQGSRAESDARTELARLELERERTEARTRLVAARQAYAGAAAAVRELEQEALPRAREADDMIEEGYRSGKTNLAALLLLRRDTLDIRREYADRLLEAALRGIELELSTGQWP